MFSADSKAFIPRPILCARLVKGFHWLFVPHRIQFNIITLMHNSMVEQLLHTIRTLSFSLSGRSTLGSANFSLHACAVQFRSPANVGPSSWNHLPLELRP